MTGAVDTVNNLEKPHRYSRIECWMICSLFRGSKLCQDCSRILYPPAHAFVPDFTIVLLIKHV